jgi:ketosteroid isomerase-like protein
MVTQRAVNEAEIRRRMDRLVDAIRAMDIEGAMSTYSADIVSFDIVPPLRHVGAQAKRRQWDDVFAIYEPPLGYETRDVTVTMGDDLAFAHSLVRVSGTLKDGHWSDFWVRWTACFRKIDGNWLIVHDHVSVPVDVESKRALLELEPDRCLGRDKRKG